MKYAVVLCDGMADYPISALKDQTPMSVAKKPCMDFLSSKGRSSPGLPEGFHGA